MLYLLEKLQSKMLVILVLSAIFWNFHVLSVSAEDRKNPVELAKMAHELFPVELAKSVQAEILADTERDQKKSNSKSVATLYLGDKFYARLKVGKFHSRPTTTWNGYDPKNNRPTFFYRKSAFAYTTSRGRKIVPGDMDTDGGSIPKILHSVGKFTPWSYGPAFIIHDWIFVAHKCGRTPDNNISFEQSAEIMAEAIKTLMEVGFVNVDGETQKFPKAEDTLYLMHKAVRSKFARNLWNDISNANCR